ncbi:MAG: transcription termination/antitermination protein NusG [Bacillota bacterium]|nr:transcription termination/antitermination protein NusG [Bacillota bacterium]
MAENPQEKWYVVHTYSGYENKVKDNLEKAVENMGMQDLILEVKVPVEEVTEQKENGEQKIVQHKIFPSYVFVKMIKTNESWYVVRNIRGVTGFVGPGSDPVPLTDDEITRMNIEKKEITIDFKVGDSVRIIDGPFQDYVCNVEKIDIEHKTVTVLVPMFNGDTPVELEFGQVETL